MIGHMSPEAALGGPLAVVREGEIININLDSKEINLEVSQKEIEERLKSWKAPVPKYKRGVLYKYGKLVSSASKGAVTS